MSNLRILIESIVDRKLSLKETSYDKIQQQLNLPTQKTRYKVGSATREGYLVPGGSVKLLTVLKGNPLRTIADLKTFGIEFNGKAFVDFRGIEKSYLGTGSGQTWTYSLFGTNKEGKEVIYDKYEGNTAGGGQAFLIIDGKKRIKASELMYKFKRQSMALDSEEIVTTAMNSLKSLLQSKYSKYIKLVPEPVDLLGMENVFWITLDARYLTSTDIAESLYNELASDRNLRLIFSKLKSKYHLSLHPTFGEKYYIQISYKISNLNTPDKTVNLN